MLKACVGNRIYMVSKYYPIGYSLIVREKDAPL